MEFFFALADAIKEGRFESFMNGEAIVEQVAR